MVANADNMNDETGNAPGGLLQGVRGSAIASALLGAGMLAVFTGERLFGAGKGRSAFSILGAILIVLALGLRALRVLKSNPDARWPSRWIERRAMDAMSIASLAVLMYFIQSDVFSGFFGQKPMSASWPKLATAFQVLWPSLWLAGIVPLLLGELAYASMVRAPRLEIGRVRDALLSGLGLAFALVFAFSITYVATERDKRADLSYFRTTRPGESTRKLVRTFDQPVNVTYFFPAGSDVREEVRTYFEDLARESPQLVVQGLDQAVDPTKAKDLGVTANGMIVIAKGARKEQMSLGLQLEQAKTQLRSLDKDVQKKLLAVARPGRTVYITTGHGERNATGAGEAAGDADKRGTIKDLRSGLAELNYTVRDLGAAEGLAADIPADAGIVMIIGPQKAFLAEEVAALVRYADRGGRMYIALDPEAKLDFKELLTPLGVIYHPVTLAQDQHFARRLNQPIDKINIVSSSYSSHPAVQSLGKSRAPTIYIGAGWLEEVPFKDRAEGVMTDMAIHSLPEAWPDADGNFNFDPPGEARRAYEVGAAITKKIKGAKPGSEEARAFVLTDSDVLTDAAILAVANRYVLIDPVRWLVGDEAIGGETSSEVDVPVAHTRNQDVIWFYSTIFLAPALALGVGWLATRKSRRKKARPSAGRPGANAGAATPTSKEAA